MAYLSQGVLVPTSTPSQTEKSTTLENYPGFRVEITRLNVDFSKIRALGAKWILYISVIWSDIEPLEGQYLWEILAPLEEALKKANGTGLYVILIGRSTPDWVQKVSGSYCGPVLPDKLQAFASFMSFIATRYKIAPIMVKYWELWNEPDVDSSLVSSKVAVENH